MVAEMLNRGVSLRCLIVSSGAPAHDAYMRAKWALSPQSKTGDQKTAAAQLSAALAHFDLNPVADVGKVHPRPGLRVFVLADPRDQTVPVGSQLVYYDALRKRGIDATFIELAKAAPPNHHSLVDLAETAAGLCAQGSPTEQIISTLRLMPNHTDRISN